ncbi:flagellin [Amaricoccus tamworthensis]|uniref:flagellin n=1 Tax=Amaricoccus tamworthensis TaxID=57002 RepID=UPI003C7C9509
MSSIVTNNAAKVALQTLKTINKDLGAVSNEVATGLKVSTAKEDSSTWSIASTMQSDQNTFSKLNEVLTSASAMVGVARSAAEQAADLVRQIQEKVVQASSPDADRGILQAEIEAMAETIRSIGNSSQYNGINMTGSAGATQTITVSVVRDTAGVLTAETMTIAAVDLDAVANSMTGLAFDGSDTDMDAVDDALDIVNAAAAAFGAAQARVEAQMDFMSKQADALDTGVGALVDADMEEASARLTALQTQQQLGTQALSIANQQPQTLLSLFQ